MSLISSRAGMRLLCHIERDSNAATSDAWGAPSSPDWDPLSTVPCSAWTNSGREATSQDRTVVVEDRRVSLPLDTDVTEKDRIASVTTKAGSLYFDGPMGISAVLRFDDHLELAVERLR